MKLLSTNEKAQISIYITPDINFNIWKTYFDNCFQREKNSVEFITDGLKNLLG